MQISFNWIKDYIQISEHPEEVMQVLTQSGLEVAGMASFEPIKGGLKNLVIGQIVTCENHPNADQLKTTLVDIGQRIPLHIVCGTPNVRVGQKVVVAPVGTLLRSHEGTALKIKKVKIRGELSEGMICAEDEIGLGHSHTGIVVLDTPLAPGTPVDQHFNAPPDTIFEIDITPNRADACSHLGIARELSVLLDRSIQYPAVSKFKLGTRSLPIHIEVPDHSACPRYSGITISGVTVQQSPPWLIDRLRAIGLRPINNIVDVTHFVLHELGQPLHAFDYDQIVGKRIMVKQCDPQTSFITLDEITKNLSGTELMICDQEGGISMAGIVGSKRTSIHPGTQNIFLESAYFSPSMIRKSAKQHAIATDTSFRCERGTDPNLTVYALQRACLLLQEITQGKISSTLIDLYPQKIEHFKVKVHYRNIKRLLGLYIPKAVIKDILSRLEIAISHEEAESFVASIPPYRVDVQREVDVIEEVIRIYGYDRIEVTGTLGSTHLASTVQPEQNKVRHKVAELMVANGYHEIYTNSLTKSSYAGLTDAVHEQHVTIINPLSNVLNVLRTTLLFSGLEVVAHNINRKQQDLKLFEFGKTYRQDDQQYLEKNRIGIWLTGNIEATNWIRKPQEATFQDMHAVLHQVLHMLHCADFTTQPLQSPFYQTGIQIFKDLTQVLTAGQVYPSLLKEMGINQPVFFADIDWSALLRTYRPLSRYQSISKFPPVKRDLSLVLNEAVNFEAVSKVITQQNNKLIKNVAVVDVYQGDKLAHGQKTYTLRFVLQEQDKTLNEKTIEQVMARLMRAFEDQLGAVIRT